MQLFEKYMLYVFVRGPEPLGALPCVVQCCLFLGPDCSVYSAGCGLNRVQVVLSGFSKRLFVLSRQQLYLGMVVCISWLHSYLCVWMWL